MLSPQDLVAWSIQRFKYCGGSLDILWNDNPLRRRLTPWQKVMYAATLYSYLAPLWTTLFLVAPILSLWLGVTPIAAYNLHFYLHLIPFLVANKLAVMLATWGVPSWRGEQYYLTFFSFNWQAIKDVLAGRPIRFKVTPKTRESRRLLELARPQLWIIAASLAGVLLMGVRVFALGEGDPSAYLANTFWSLNNVAALSAIVLAALKRPAPSPSEVRS
jgi:cellulose synthase (UDP-forming)